LEQLAHFDSVTAPVPLQPTRFQGIPVLSKVLVQFKYADFGVFQQLGPGGNMSQFLGTFLYCGNNLISAHSLLLMKTRVAQPPSAVELALAFVFSQLPMAKSQEPVFGFFALSNYQ
jgi:hypothetical protein